MKKVFKTVASSVMTVSMLASLVPATFADGEVYNEGFNRQSLHEAIKKHAAEKDITYTYDDEALHGTAHLTLEADTMLKKSTAKNYQDSVISKSMKYTEVSDKNPLSLTGDFMSKLYMQPVRDAFEAYQAAAHDEDHNGDLSVMLPMVPVTGDFTIDVIYDARMQLDPELEEEYTKEANYGKMIGFNKEAAEVFTDKKRTVDDHNSDPNVPEGYKRFRVYVEVKAPHSEEYQGIPHVGAWENILVYADLDKAYQTLLGDIEFYLPTVTVSTDKLEKGEKLYFTESISMNGSIKIGGALSTISFDTRQLGGDDKTNPHRNDYKGVTDWQKISATMALEASTASDGGGGGGIGSNTVVTPVPNKPTIAPLGTPTPNPDGSTPEPGSTSTPIPGDYDPNNSPAPGGPLDPNAPTGPSGPSGTKPFVPTNSTVPSALNGEDHIVYVIGYPEGDVRPLNSITREEIATILYRLLTDEKRNSIYTKESGFDDVLKSRWSNKAIATMANGKYLLGDAGTKNFRPGDAITRGEMAAIVSRFLDTTPDIADSSNDFNDLNGHWAETAVKQGVAAGWLTGYEDSSFKPDQLITRAEAMTVINRMLVRYVDADGVVDGYYVEWPDNPKDAWYYYNVIEATCSHEYAERTFATPADFYEKWTEEVVNWIWGEFKTQYEDPDEIDKQ